MTAVPVSAVLPTSPATARSTGARCPRGLGSRPTWIAFTSRCGMELVKGKVGSEEQQNICVIDCVVVPAVPEQARHADSIRDVMPKELLPLSDSPTGAFTNCASLRTSLYASAQP